MTLEQLSGRVKQMHADLAMRGGTATHLYIGSAEWKVLRPVYGLHPELYCHLHVIQVRAHEHLAIGVEI